MIEPSEPAGEDMDSGDEQPQESQHSRRRIIRSILGVLAVLLACVVLGAFVAAIMPPPVPDSSPEPAESYEEALSMVQELQAKDTTEVAYGTVFMGHGSTVTTAVVLLHGYTNNPKQFEQIGQAYHDAGYNVLIPRLPGHGMKDVMTRALSEVDAASLVNATDAAIDIAAGLGENVEVVGLSGGGTLTAWAGYNRDEVMVATPVSPLFEPAMLPTWVVRPITELTRVIPDIYIWWDPTKKEDHIPKDAYPRYSLRSIAAFLDVGYSVDDRDAQRETVMREAVYVSNGADESVNEKVGERIFKERVGAHADAFTFHEFPKSDGYAHDVIDPAGLNADHIEEIYAQLFPWIGLEPPESSGGQ